MEITEREKKILKKGTFMEQSNLLMNHFYDKNNDWVIKAREYFNKHHPIN